MNAQRYYFNGREKKMSEKERERNAMKNKRQTQCSIFDL